MSVSECACCVCVYVRTRACIPGACSGGRTCPSSISSLSQVWSSFVPWIPEESPTPFKKMKTLGTVWNNP